MPSPPPPQSPPAPSPAPTAPLPPIWHTTLGSPLNPPLLLLHGIFSSHLEFTPLLPSLLPSFYIILIDLPSHSNSNTLTPSTSSPLPTHLSTTLPALAHLIRTISPTGTTHIASLSYGSFLSLALAQTYPDLVLSLFASGAPPFEGKEAYFAARPGLLWFAIAPFLYMPDIFFTPLCRWYGVTIPPGLRDAMRGNFTWALLRDGYADCLRVGMQTVGRIRGVRVAVVAGGRQDNVEVTRRMGVVMREADGGSGCGAFVVRKGIHAWDLQFPELFAEGIRCWVEGGEMPSEFEELV